MKKNKLIGLFAVLTAVLVLYGCTDEYLQDTKTNGITTQTVYAGEATAVATVTAIYDSFQAEYSDEYNTKSIFILNHLTLDYQGNGSNEGSVDFEIGTGNEMTGKMWPVHYIGIGKANSVIASMPGAIENEVLTPELGNRLIGEALVLRSIFYYYLAGTMGGVPLVIDPPSTETDFFAPRNTQDEVFQQMVLDLETAIPSLPWSYTEEKGRVTKATAYAFLGSAYMWLGKYNEAVTAFEAIEGHGIELEEDFGRVHAYDNQNNKESIFEIQFNDEGNLSWDRNDASTYLQSFCMPNEISNAGYGGHGTEAFYNSFEALDLRRPWTVIGPGEEHPDPAIDIMNYSQSGGMNTLGTVSEPWLGQGSTGYSGVKTWRNPETTEWNGPALFSGQNHIWLRYGEVLVSLAEAAQKSGQQAKADAAIQRIRDRAWGGSAPAVSGVTMTDIMNEYRHEIGGEFSSWVCIRRANDPALATAVFGLNTTTPRGMLLPIPGNQIGLNESLEQNPGY